MAEFTLVEKHRALVRELGYRRRVYPRLVDGGRMTVREMEQQLAIMEAIVEDYRRQLMPRLGDL